MTVPVVADIDFDLRRMLAHFGIMAAMIVAGCIEVERILYEFLVLQVEHATNSEDFELEFEPGAYYQRRCHQ